MEDIWGQILVFVILPNKFVREENSLVANYVPAPTFLSPGDTAWQLTAATLVGLMSIPGLAVLYGGLVKKNGL